MSLPVTYRVVASTGELLLARFKAKVRINEETGCHEWQGARHSNGYGQLRADGVLHYAHRLAWQLFVGRVPRRLFVLHHCDNRRCVNIGHLFLGTQKQNIADSRQKGRFGRRDIGATIVPWRPVPPWRREW